MRGDTSNGRKMIGIPLFSRMNPIYSHRAQLAISYEIKKSLVINQQHESNYRSMRVKVWDFICGTSRSRLVRYTATMDAQKYLDMLKTDLKNILPCLMGTSAELISIFYVRQCLLPYCNNNQKLILQKRSESSAMASQEPRPQSNRKCLGWPTKWAIDSQASDSGCRWCVAK